jgi:uncharacterized protein (TIGR03083 family)
VTGRYRPAVVAIDTDEWIARESEDFAVAIDTGDLDARVPGCPDWSLRDLAWHLGRVQRFWERVVLAGADVPPERPDLTAPSERVALAAWMRESTAVLRDALQRTDPATPAWTWWRDDRTVGAIARHQVQEAAVHRWDAQSVAGMPEPLAAPIADDGVEEFVWIARQLREPAPITLFAIDSGRTFPLSDATPAVTVSAPASDLVLLLYRRLGTDAVEIEGDPAVLAALLQPIG